MNSVIEVIQNYEPALRVAAFVGGALLFTVLENARPRRLASSTGKRRLFANYGLTVINAIVLRALFPLLAFEAALSATARGWGLLNILDLSPMIAGMIGFLVLDLMIYWQHRIFHRFPVLWRLHRMHHSDVALDVSSAIRFHPIEIVLSMGLKIAVVVALGIPAYAVVVFEIVLTLTAMFNHANLDIGRQLNDILVKGLVTPDMHSIHHSTRKAEMHSNFGFNLSIWDRIFGSYRSTSIEAPETMAIGLDRWRDENDQRIDHLLLQPFDQDAA